jgi:hypothetical protein
MNASGLYQVHFDAQQIVKIREQSAKVEQPAAAIQVHEEVDVTVRPVLACGYRAEYADIAAAV